MSHLKIPQIVYDNLRSINESRARRQDQEATIPHLTNAQIFALMPDNRGIIWEEEHQPRIMTTTLARMWDTVQFPE